MRYYVREPNLASFRWTWVTIQQEQQNARV
jgi:hypothetical protein